jgi:hypothetical protein
MSAMAILEEVQEPAWEQGEAAIILETAVERD